MMFYTHYTRPEKVYEKIEQKEHELHDPLRPWTVAEQVARFTVAGELYSQTKRRELASIRDVDFDDPEDFETGLDSEHITPSDLAVAMEAIKARHTANKKPEESRKKAGDNSSESVLAEVDSQKKTPAKKDTEV